MSRPHTLRLGAAPNGGPPTPTAEGPGARPAAPESLLWSIEEAALALAVSVRSLKRMDAAGELPSGAVVRLGRRRLFVPAVLREWCGRGCPPPVKARGRGRK